MYINKSIPAVFNQIKTASLTLLVLFYSCPDELSQCHYDLQEAQEKCLTGRFRSQSRHRWKLKLTSSFILGTRGDHNRFPGKSEDPPKSVFKTKYNTQKASNQAYLSVRVPRKCLSLASASEEVDVPG